MVHQILSQQVQKPILSVGFVLVTKRDIKITTSKQELSLKQINLSMITMLLPTIVQNILGILLKVFLEVTSLFWIPSMIPNLCPLKVNLISGNSSCIISSKVGGWINYITENNYKGLFMGLTCLEGYFKRVSRNLCTIVGCTDYITKDTIYKGVGIHRKTSSIMLHICLDAINIFILYILWCHL